VHIGPVYRYGGNVSAFAGTTTELTIADSAALDDIRFSPQPIPEPTTIALAMLSLPAIALVFRRRVR
jgi:hypothetical protein